MTTLFLVRHGETVWHDGNRYTGSSDVALTPRGHEQARELGAWAAGARLDALYTSDLSRSIETARPSAEATGLPLVTDARLREVDFGEGEGLRLAQIRERFPEAVDAFLAMPATSPFPGGERGVDAVARALPALEEIAARHAGGRVLLVVHSTLMRLVIATLIGIDPDRYRTVFPRVTNCALTELLWGAGEDASLLAFNVPPRV